MPDLNRQSRREMLRRSSLAAAGVGAVWVAPTVDTFLSPAAAASLNCVGPPQTVDWSTMTENLNNSSLAAGSLTTMATLGGVDMNFQFTGAISTLNFSSDATIHRTGVAPTLLTGNQTGSFVMKRTATIATTTVTLTITFSQNITGLTFTILDIDRIVGTFQDRLTLSASLNGFAVTPTFTPQTGVGGSCNGQAATVTANGGGVFTGTAQIANDCTRANLLVALGAAQVDTFVIEYTSLEGTTGPQHIGLGDVSWFC